MRNIKLNICSIATHIINCCPVLYWKMQPFFIMRKWILKEGVVYYLQPVQSFSLSSHVLNCYEQTCCQKPQAHDHQLEQSYRRRPVFEKKQSTFTIGYPECMQIITFFYIRKFRVCVLIKWRYNPHCDRC